MRTEKQLANLKKGKALTTEEAKRMGSAGGKKSVQVRRERKKIKEDLLIMLDTIMSNGKTTQENWMTALAKNLLKGDIQTSNFVRDTIGEKPKEEISVDMPVSITFAEDDFGEDE